ncbi:MAG: tripartite tricarboxylate transporter TctB family protein [Deltaproteobacteria bacterium]|nr:tripartite tricarboxylate transporter TctB family protein [Deltaproteobacteria bacterium]
MKAEYLSALVIALISFLACVGAWKLGPGQIGSPGPGFFPLVLGATTGVFSLIILAGQLWKRTKGVDAEPGTTGGAIKVVCILAALVAYGFLLEKIGYIFTSLIVFTFLFKVAGSKNGISLVRAFVVAVVSYILFSWLLGVQLPKTPLGI